MATSFSLRSLRNVLFLDAATCVACGAVMSLGAGPLSSATQIPAALLSYAGLSLFPIAAFMAYVGARGTRSAPLVWAVVAGNALWVLASLALLVSDAIAPNLFGQVFVVAEAAVVALLALLEVAGQRRGAAEPAGAVFAGATPGGAASK